MPRDSRPAIPTRARPDRTPDRRRAGLWRRLSVIAGLLALLLAAPATAATPDGGAALCDRAAAEAAARTGVPVAVLRAISLTETGRKRGGRHRPWPWTVNMEGKGLWLDDRASALAYVHRHHARGARSFDVGCFQINYRWHGRAFESIEQMFDPLANALYAAKFLRRLHAETGDWGRAAGAYHSRTPKFARRYQKRFERIHAGLTGTPPPRTPPPRTLPDAAPEPGGRSARANGFPLLLADAEGIRAPGSLVPMRAGGAGSLFAPAGRP